jgi:hypothetical protein
VQGESLRTFASRFISIGAVVENVWRCRGARMGNE